MSKFKDTLAKEIFDMVYQWGRVGLVVDSSAPAFQSLMDEFLTKTETFSEINFHNHADGDVCDVYNRIDNGSPNSFKPPTDCNCWKNALIRNLGLLEKSTEKEPNHVQE